MKIKALAGLLFSLFIFLQPLAAQEERRKNIGDHHDWGMWTKADASYNIGKWKVTGLLEYRMNQHITRPSRYSPQMYVYFKPNKLLRFSYGYELYLDDDGWQNIDVKHRMLLQGEIFFNIQNFRFANRTSLYNDFVKMSDPTWVVRDRLQCSYPIKQFKPYVYAEFYFDFPSGINHQKDRFAAGLDYELTDKHSIGAYYMLEQVVNNSFSNHILGINYSFSIN